MKKLFLLFAASALVISAVAQKPAVNPIPVKMHHSIKKAVGVNEVQSNNAPAVIGHTSKSIAPIFIGRSGNAYSSLLATSNFVSYEPTTGVLGFIHRGGPVVGTSSEILNSISIDGGTTWDSTMIVYSNVDYWGRYPSGGLWNPAGNTDPNNVYSIAVGPGLPGGSGWGATYIGWKKMNGTAKNFVDEHANANRLDRNHFTILPSGKMFFTGYAHEDDGTNYTKFHFGLTSATLDATTDTLTEYTYLEVVPPFAKFGTDTIGSGGYSSAIAFNKAGTVGYYVFIGIRGDIADPTTNLSFRPIVYKTIDEGLTWNIQPDFDFGTLANINQVLPGLEADTTKIVPYFNAIDDVVVDGDDNLHIVSYITGQSTIHLDSLGYTWGWSTIEGIMYDTYMTSGGNWDATIIDIQNTTDYTAADATMLDLDGRLQVGISGDGKNIFYTWADSDPNTVTENILPDLYVVGRHIDSAYVSLDKLNLTTDGDLQYGATNHCMAPQVKDLNDGTFAVYNVITQFGSEPANDPVNYMFLNDVKYDLYVGINNNIDRNIASVSNLYPNPTNGLTNVDLSLVKNADVSAEVVNMMGQTVYTQDYGFKTVGMHKLTINATDLTSGIYFVTVRAGNSTSTSKMIVK